MASFDHTVYRDALSRFGDVQTVTVTQQAMSEKTNSTKRKATKSPNKGEWTNVDTTGLDAKQKAELAESLVARPRKTARAINNDAPKKQNVGQIAGKHPENVKSAAKSTKKAKPKAKQTTPAPEAKTEEKRQLGRPSDYCQEIADLICEALAEGHSLRRICQSDNMPNKGTVFVWLAKHKDFADQYARAREAQADCLFDDMIEIADDGSNDTYKDENGNTRTDHDVIARSKLRVETRKWMAGKLKPKVYGDKVDVNHGVQPDNPLAALLAQINGSALPVAQDAGEE